MKKNKRNNDNSNRKDKRQSIHDILRQINNPDKPCKAPELHPDFTLPDSPSGAVKAIVAHMRTAEKAADEVITIPLEKYDTLIAIRSLMNSIRALCKRNEIMGGYYFHEVLRTMLGIDEPAPSPAPAPGDTNTE